ncbi:Response regulator receiver domain-containing protein [Dyadobacter sp. SG02]|uniref:response regulator n=1 Tax=Dyadobacter sp. SG02 TaxID=1855291 RepID=UPI0008C7620C|nr:response regulator transcription factor [Dyadobacter sp. SG02]SEJ16038.1 Response regulator receiver domain-containing protein [Dyadobacter sp. SG02]
MNVALVDEHPVFRTGVRALLKSQFDNIATLEIGSMQDLEKVTQLEIFDIIIIGQSEEHPEIDYPVLKRLMKKNPLTSFIVYASAPDQKLARSLVRTGVKGILTKHACPTELVTCIRSVLSHNPYLSPQMLANLKIKEANAGH